MPITDHIRNKLSTVPHRPGVYLHKDRFGTVIYIGKARDLRKRVSQYFHPSRRMGWDLKFNALVDAIHDFDWHTVAADTAEVYRAAGAIMKARGLLQGVADEGGWWPAFDANEQALETLVAAIEQAGFRPGRDVAIALDIAATDFGRDGRYRLGLEGRELDTDGMIRLLLGWLDAYPIAKHREGIYVQLNHDGDGQQVAPLERAMRLSEDVIRYLTVKQTGPMPPPRALVTTEAVAASAATAPAGTSSAEN